jgi:hypothetical protein
MKKYLSLILLGVLLNVQFIQSIGRDDPLDDLINELADKVNSYQVLKEQDYKPPFKWAEKLGLFRSDIRVNLFGNKILQEVRHGQLTAIFDNDMFSTGWIVTTLLEASLYGKGAPLFDSERLELAMTAIGAYHNRNENNFEKSIIRTFWPQVYNETYNIWQQQPINIRHITQNLDKIPWIKIADFFRFIKLDSIADKVALIAEVDNDALNAFCIPPDFDDTYLNLGLGATLSKLKNQYPKVYNSWLSNNTEINRLAEVTSKYAYRPFDLDIDKNVIDTRTYFWSREFIYEAQSAGQPLALITTWIQNIGEQKVLKDERVSMPFNINNVDVTVCANSIYGITSGSIFNTNDFGTLFLNTPDLQHIYLNSTKLIGWAIQRNFSSRPDLAQVYYPSLYNFLWYSSRTLFLIENEYKKFEYMIQTNDVSEIEHLKRLRDLSDILQEAKYYLQVAFENEATDDLFKKLIRVDDNNVYFRDFLGLNDTNIFGKPESNNDDALFSTAQAINIIINTWTYQKPDTKALTWKDNATQKVKDLLKSAINWLKSNIFNSDLKAANAFFSGSVKGLSSLPFWYPANYNVFLSNGTSFDPNKISQSDLGNTVIGVQGVMTEDEFQKQLKEKHFNVTTPIDFVGYNVKENVFPFWSSEPYTYACAMLAFAQYNNLE